MARLKDILATDTDAVRPANLTRPRGTMDYPPNQAPSTSRDIQAANDHIENILRNEGVNGIMEVYRPGISTEPGPQPYDPYCPEMIIQRVDYNYSHNVEASAAKKGPLNEDDHWSEDAKVRHVGDVGVFADGGPRQIAEFVLNRAKGNTGDAIKKLVFYANRAGDNLSQERRSVMNKAKAILQNKHAEKSGAVKASSSSDIAVYAADSSLGEKASPAHYNPYQKILRGAVASKHVIQALRDHAKNSPELREKVLGPAHEQHKALYAEERAAYKHGDNSAGFKAFQKGREVWDKAAQHVVNHYRKNKDPNFKFVRGTKDIHMLHLASRLHSDHGVKRKKLID